MIGAIAGDIIGSVYEHRPVKTKQFDLFNPLCRFTDDTVLTIAIADSILQGKDYSYKLKEYFRRYPNAGYGGMFMRWAMSDKSNPYNSWGNGSAMRVSPVGYAFKKIDKVLIEAKKSAEVTHNHSEGIKGAQAVAAAVFLARNGFKKNEIKKYIIKTFSYKLSNRLDEIRKNYKFDVSCQGTVPQAIVAFLESKNYEDAVRNAVSLGGDSDTLACITGSIAEAYYKIVPDYIVEKSISYLDEFLAGVVDNFRDRFMCMK